MSGSLFLRIVYFIEKLWRYTHIRLSLLLFYITIVHLFTTDEWILILLGKVNTLFRFLYSLNFFSVPGCHITFSHHVSLVFFKVESSQLIGHYPAKPRVTVSIPTQDKSWVAGSVPSRVRACVRGKQSMFFSCIAVSLPLLSPSLPHSLKIKK